MSELGLIIRRGQTYTHDDYGEVTVINIRTKLVAVSMEASGYEEETKYTVEFEYDAGIRTGEEHIDEFAEAVAE